MSKTISANLLAHIQGEVLTVATLWRVVCALDSFSYYFTDHDEDIVYAGNTYVASTGYTRTSISSSVALDVDQLQIEGLIDDVSIVEADLRAGKFDFAFVEISIINYVVPTDGIMIMRQGHFGEVALKDSFYVVELRGLTQLFANEILYTFNVDCSADLGDSRCTIDLANSNFYQDNLGVDSFTDNQTFVSSLMPAAPTVGAWVFGYIQWDRGANAGRKMEIKAFTNGTKTVKLFLPMPYDINPATDQFTAVAGCDKKVPTCRDTYGNLPNYRGFPFIPTVREMLKYPDMVSGGYSSGGS